MAAYLAGALRAGGVRTALYTSPHLVDVRERMVVDGQPISADAFAAWTSRLRPAVERLGASFFEATTAIAFADAAARGADVAVVEVGLGGRLDSTNVLDPLVSVVTHVALEHTEYLGASLDSIAREKAGIAKPGRPFVVGETDPAVVAVLADAAVGAGARVIPVAAGDRYDGPLRMRGEHQRRNAAVAYAALEALPGDLRPAAPAIRRGFASAWLPGRFDVRGKWIFDVAHNPDGIATLLAGLHALQPPRPLQALVGVLRDKDWDAMVQAVAGGADHVWATMPASAPPERRWDLARVAALPLSNLTVEADFDTALGAARQGAETVLVTGSFHTVGDAMARLPGFAPLG